MATLVQRWRGDQARLRRTISTVGTLFALAGCARVDTVLAEHLKIEQRIAAGNSPGAIEKAKRARETFLKFKEWRAQQDSASACGQTSDVPSEIAASKLPAFRDWLASREAHSGERS